MSPCYYCGSKLHSIRECSVDWRDFIIWEEMFNYEVGYMGEINCNMLWCLKKKTLMRIASLDCVSRIQKLSQDGNNIECSLVNIKLNQEKKNLIDAIVQRYNQNKEVLEKFRNKITIDKTEECPICYDQLNDAFCTTKCGHKFCTDCFVLTIRRLPCGARCPMCRTSLIPNLEDRQPVNRRNEFENSRNREQRGTTGLFQGNITAEDGLNNAMLADENIERLDREARESETVSWSIDRTPVDQNQYNVARRLFSEEDYISRREEEEEVGF